ncbi:MAG: hypothetical protein JWM76_2059, partial [Pseudonocardiales bacterium]|nr:hypothetical protein [Pseudonocardiales bacterium]
MHMMSASKVPLAEPERKGVPMKTGMTDRHSGRYPARRVGRQVQSNGSLGRLPVNHDRQIVATFGLLAFGYLLLLGDWLDRYQPSRKSPERRPFGSLYVFLIVIIGFGLPFLYVWISITADNGIHFLNRSNVRLVGSLCVLVPIPITWYFVHSYARRQPAAWYSACGSTVISALEAIEISTDFNHSLYSYIWIGVVAITLISALTHWYRRDLRQYSLRDLSAGDLVTSVVAALALIWGTTERASEGESWWVVIVIAILGIIVYGGLTTLVALLSLTMPERMARQQADVDALSGGSEALRRLFLIIMEAYSNPSTSLAVALAVLTVIDLSESSRFNVVL